MKTLLVRMVAKNADLSRKVVDYEAVVSSMTQQLEAAHARLNDSQQKLCDSGRDTPAQLYVGLHMLCVSVYGGLLQQCE